jgi:hypothetical protein
MEIYIHQSDKPIVSFHANGPTTWLRITAGTAAVNIFLPEPSTGGPALAEALNQALKND